MIETDNFLNKAFGIKKQKKGRTFKKVKGRKSKKAVEVNVVV